MGPAGIAIRFDGRCPLVDPSLSRLPSRRMWFGRVTPDGEAVRRLIRPAAFVFIHCDDVFRPLDWPLVPYFMPPRGIGVPFRRVDLRAAAVLARGCCPALLRLP